MKINFPGFLTKRRVVVTILCLFLLAIYWNCIPDNLFKDPVSTVVVDKKNNLLSARIAKDGQWRFPSTDSVPEAFQKAILCFEDKRFYNHMGVDPLAFLRALKLNIKNNEVVSGGSTITMQVVRLSRKGKSRSVIEKMIEMVMATRLEMSYSKKEILAMYAANAPFGGNVVGLEAASWKYYGRAPQQLSMGEMATLAVLPNAPSLINPGKNRKSLKTKRDRLLNRMKDAGLIDSVTCYLSKEEELPEKPLTLPDIAPHLTERILKETGSGTNSSVYHSTIDLDVQKYAQKIIQRHHLQLRENNIHNAAALVLDTKSGDVLAYIGNVQSDKNEHGNAVDLISSKRSTGSIIKPLLYASMLNDGLILPHTLIPDIPTYYGTYTPKNFSLEYDGALPASAALSRSLNIPTARMLNEYGVDKFYANLKSLGMTTLSNDARHYGLSIVLGGAETTLEDISGIYAGLGRTLTNYNSTDGKYDVNSFRKINYDLTKSYRQKENVLVNIGLLDAASIWHTFESMSDVVRPDIESNWQSFSSSSKMAWKTGTSFGFRDAWAVGCTPQYTIAVWVGNAEGEGRPNLTGISVAAPILFDILNGLNKTTQWFEMPVKNMKEIIVCKKSGHRATEICTETEMLLVPSAGLKTIPCPYHTLIHLDEKEQFRVTSNCYSPTEMITKSYFVLPPAQELYYKSKNPDYVSLPGLKEGCTNGDGKTMEIIYPTANSKLYVPVNLDGSTSKAVFKASHPDSKEQLFWHIDYEYIGETNEKHEIALNPTTGKHVLTIITGKGEMIKRTFQVMDR